MNKRIWFYLWIILIAAAGNFTGAAPNPARAQSEGPLVVVLTADGAVTPAMFEYLKRGIRQAENLGAEALIFRLNTPGGGLDLTLDMVEHMRASNVPIVVYVWPRAIAGSAGTVITLAGHAAAMAPETAMGAASPVGGEGEDLGETIEGKLKNMMKATVRSLTERRLPSATELAEATIESAEAVSATEALESGLVDFIADDVDDLLAQLDGYAVELHDGQRVLNTAGAEVEEMASSPIEEVLGILTNPNVVFLLLTIGVQAILIELSSPGGWVAGFIGVVSLALATYGLGILPVNWFGLIFLVTAFVLFLLDIKAPTHGALTAAGIASLIVGALVLFNTPSVPSVQRVSVPLVVGTSLVTGGIFFAILLFAVRAQKTPVRTGMESMVGKIGTVRIDLKPSGTVQIGGERWSAELMDREASAAEGTQVEVMWVEGVKLYVRAVDQAT